MSVEVKLIVKDAGRALSGTRKFAVAPRKGDEITLKPDGLRASYLVTDTWHVENDDQTIRYVAVAEPAEEEPKRRQYEDNVIGFPLKPTLE